MTRRIDGHNYLVPTDIELASGSNVTVAPGLRAPEHKIAGMRTDGRYLVDHDETQSRDKMIHRQAARWR